MSLEAWALFAATELLLCLTPGPAVLLIVGASVTSGQRAAFWSSLGVLVANTNYFVLSALGLTAALLTSHTLFMAIKWAGAAYLI
jgi:homoserine/homoserine lactone efflux protein